MYLLTSISSPALARTRAPTWDPAFGDPGMDGFLFSTVVIDDGSTSVRCLLDSCECTAVAVSVQGRFLARIHPVGDILLVNGRRCVSFGSPQTLDW